MEDLGKKLELIVIQHDPIYKDLMDAVGIFKDFIRSRGLILYGGTAIDYALRLRGDCIYPDEALIIPDFDFYSPDSVNDAYDLAEILCDAGFSTARAIVGAHMDTMRVDPADNHFIADIHYIPRVIFEKIPTLMYEGMKIVHPSFQRIDLHSSLAYPYDDPPREVLFARWNKDIKRFNKLHAAYPITPGNGLETQKLTARGLKQFVFTGFLAYAAIYRHYTDSGAALDGIAPAVFTAETVDADTQVTFDCVGRAEIIHLDPEAGAKKLRARDIKRFEAYAGVLPRRIECAADVPVTIYSTKHRLASINSVIIDGLPFRVINVQGLLRHFAAVAILNPGTRLAGTCWSRYCSLMRMIAGTEKTNPRPGASPLMLSINTYGSENVNHSTERMLSYVYRELDGAPVQTAPRNYRPGESRVRTPFDYEKNYVFADRGRELATEI